MRRGGRRGRVGPFGRASFQAGRGGGSRGAGRAAASVRGAGGAPVRPRVSLQPGDEAVRAAAAVPAPVAGECGSTAAWIDGIEGGEGGALFLFGCGGTQEQKGGVAFFGGVVMAACVRVQRIIWCP